MMHSDIVSKRRAVSDKADSPFLCPMAFAVHRREHVGDRRSEIA
jgi:hypothetical protein